MKFYTKRFGILLLAIVYVCCFGLWTEVSAAQLTARSVRIGSSNTSVVTQHQYSFTLMSTSNIGSIFFQYCSNSPLIGTPCTAPAGLNVSGAVLSAQSGEAGFIVDPATNANSILISRAPAANSAIPVSYTFTNITNPSTPGQTVYVRVGVYATNNGTGPYTDEGSVAFAPVSPVQVSGFVPPFLIFCVGVTVSGDCSSQSGQLLNFGELSDKQPSFATSQFAGATNDPGGYVVFVNGLTMTSGSNTINALASPTGSIVGTSQFGMNLRANTNPGVGSDSSGLGTATATPDYNVPNAYVFKNQQVIGSPLPTNFNLFTVSYLVNISENQAPGVYNTTLTYVATAAF